MAVYLVWQSGTNLVMSRDLAASTSLAPHVLYAVVDPANALAEYDEANDSQSVRIGGTDLAVTVVSHRAEVDGAVRVIAQAQNLGAPAASASVLAIRREADGASGPVLATAEVPMLEPGRLAQVAVDLPPGTQPEGEALYRLFVDEPGSIPDVNTNNNSASFAVNLWIDSDGDNMPDGWEVANASAPLDSADGPLDSDGDGLSNLAEYQAGTDPKDATSYLRIQSISAGGVEGVELVWGSAPNRLYTVLRPTAVETSFIPVAEHIIAAPLENVYLDTTATNANQFFYRIRVE